MDILIAGVSARGLVESAVRSGLDHRIVAADYFGDFDLGRLCTHRSIQHDLSLPYDPAHLMTVASDLTWDTLAYVANLENHPSVVEMMAGNGRILGNSPAVLSSVRDPAQFFGCLDRVGIPAPRMANDSNSSHRDANILWLRKPLRGGGGHGIAPCLPGDRLEPECFLQEFLDGLPCGAVFAADGQDACLLGISEQLIGRTEFGAEGFHYCGSILGCVANAQVEWSDLVRSLRQIVSAVTKEFRLVGVNGIDFILKDKTVYPLEINPRYTASMELVERGCGLNIFTTHLNACQGRLPDFDLLAHLDTSYYGKAILFATRPLIFSEPQFWFDRDVRDLPFAGEQIAKGKPVCTLFSHGYSRSVCLNHLLDMAAGIQQACSDVTPPVWQHA